MKWKCPKCGRVFEKQDQQHYCVRPQTVGEYIELQDEGVRPKLLELRAILRASLPDAAMLSDLCWGWGERKLRLFLPQEISHTSPTVPI